MRPPLLIATTNLGKFAEFRELLGSLPIDLKSLREFPGAPAVAENEATYLANAVRKATIIAAWARCAALADDSGLEVDALGGAPGVQSARYAGAEQDSAANVAKLLAALRDVPPTARTARFRCVIVVAHPDGTTRGVEGTCEGQITMTPRGDAGFGYDPVFLYPPMGLTFAEMSAVAKNQVSHRAHACRQLRRQLVAFVGAA